MSFYVLVRGVYEADDDTYIYRKVVEVVVLNEIKMKVDQAA